MRTDRILSVKATSLFHLMKAWECMEAAGRTMEMPIHEIARSAEDHLTHFFKAFKENPRDALPCSEWMKELKEGLIGRLSENAKLNGNIQEEVAWVIASGATLGVLHTLGALTGKFDVPGDLSGVPDSMAYNFKRGVEVVQSAFLTENPLELREYSQYYAGVSKRFLAKRLELDAKGHLRWAFKLSYIQGLVVAATIANRLIHG